MHTNAGNENEMNETNEQTEQRIHFEQKQEYIWTVRRAQLW